MAWICDKNGVRKCEAKRLSYNGVFMDVSSITVTIESPSPIDFAIGDYIDWDYDGMRYTLDASAAVEKQARSNSIGNAFIYENLVFLSPLSAAEHADFLDVVIGNQLDFHTNTEFSFFGTAWDYAKRLEANLCRLYGAGSWKVRIWTNGVCYDSAPATLDTGAWEGKLVDVSRIKCLAGFKQIYDLWGCAYVFSVVDGVNYVDFYDDFELYAKAWEQEGVAKIFAYGKGNGLYKIRHTQDADHVLVTRLRAYGSSENIPANYYLNSPRYHVDGNESSELAIANLMLPASEWTKGGVKHPSNAYIEQNVDLYGVREASVYWDGSDSELGEIKPSIYKLTIQDLLNYMSAGEPYRPVESKWPDTSQRIDEIITGAQPTDNGVVKEAGYDFTVVALSLSFVSHYLGAITVDNEVKFGTLDMSPQLPLISELAEYRLVPQGNDHRVVSFVVPEVNASSIRSVSAYITPYIGTRMVENATIPMKVVPRAVTVDNATTMHYEIFLEDSSENFIVFSASRTGALRFSIRALIDYTTEDHETFEVHRYEHALNFNVVRGGKVIDKFFSVIVPQVGFDLAAAVSSGAMLCMRSGYNQPREFPIVPSSVRYNADSDTWYVRCKRVPDDSIGTYFPNSDAPIVAGDEYYFTGIAMPALFVEIAAQRLLSAASAWLALHSKPRMLSSVDVDNKIMAEEGIVLKEGMSLPLNDTDLGITPGTQESRVIDNIRIEEGESSIRTFSITLRDKKERSSLDAAIRGATSGLATTSSVNAVAKSVQQQEHGSLSGRDMPDQHPISSITGLEEALMSNSFFELDDDGNVKLKDQYNGLWAKGFITAGCEGSSQGGGGGADLQSVWLSLKTNEDEFANEKIHAGHLPIGSGLTINSQGLIDVTVQGGVTSVAGMTGDVLAADLLEALNLDDVVSNVSVLMQRTNWDNYFGIDQETGAIFVKPIDENTPRGFYSLGYVSAGGVGTSSGGGGGADLLDMWVSLRDNTPNEDFYNWKINAGHLPLGSGLTVDANGRINVGAAGSVAWTNVTGKPTTVSGYGITDAVTSASYNSTTKRIELKCGNVIISYIDATAFIKDGMVSNVQVTGGYLVISFNTDAGQEDIRIPISDIFNADNYYDKTASDARFFLAENFTAANIVSTLGNTPVARASRLDGDTALSIWGVEYWANGVPKAVTVRPGLYLAGTQVNTSAATDTLLGVTALSSSLSSGSSDKSRIEWDSQNNAWHFYGGIYADSFVSAGGVGTSSSGGDGASLLVVWRSLTNDNTVVDADITSTLKIAAGHIPDMASTYGYLKSNQTITLTGLVTGTGTTTIVTSIADGALSIAKVAGLQSDLNTAAALLQSLQAQIDSVASRDNYDELTATAFYADTAAVSGLYAGAISLGGADLAGSLSSLSSRASSLESRAASLEGRASVLEGYFTNGSANSALRLTTVSKTAWGQTFWTADGVPTDVSGNMTGVGSLSASGLIKTTNYLQGTRLYLTDSVYLEYDSDSAGVKLVGAGFWTESYVTAGGIGPSSGGGGDVDLDRVWESLTNNIDFPNVKINTAHIPDTASIYGYLKGNQTITLTGVVTGSGTTSIATSIADGALTIAKTNGLQAALNAKQDVIQDLETIRANAANGNTAYGWGATISDCLRSLQSQIDSIASRGPCDELSATDIYADVFAGSTAYFGTVYGVLSGTASNATNADNADKLDGVHASGLFTELTTSAGSTNLYITIGGTRLSKTVYAYYDSDGGVIASNMTTIGAALRSIQSQVDSVASRNCFDELTATSFFADMLSVGTNAVVGGAFDVKGAASVGGSLSVSSTANLYGALNVSGLVTVAGGLKLTTTKKIWFDDTHYIELDSNGHLHTNAGFYSDSFITAGGVNATNS